MICKFCNCENADESVYCKNCGRKLDDKNLCPNCGNENDADALFCKQCGTALSAGANVVTHVAERRQKPVSEAPRISGSGTAVSSRPTWKRVLEIVGATSLMVALFFTLLFTFFVGITVKVNGSGDLEGLTDSMGLSNLNCNLYYFFGNAYKDIDDTDISGCYLATQYIPAVIGTIIAAGLIVSVLALTAVAIVRFVGHFRGKNSNSFVSPVITAFAILLIGSIVLVAMRYISISMSYFGLRISLATVPNGETISGLVIAAACIGIFVACSFVVKGKDFCKKQNILALVFTVIIAVVSAILLTFAVKGTYFQKEENVEYASGRAYGSIMLYSSDYYMDPDADFVPLIIATLGLFAQIALIVTATLCLRSQLIKGTGGQSKPLGLSIAAFALACVYLVLAVVLAHLTSMDSELSVKFTAPIVALVLSAILMATCITQTVLNRPAKANE